MHHPPHAARHAPTATAAIVAALFAAPALAIRDRSRNPDLEMRWDNTFRYNLGARASQNPAILGAPTTTTATATSPTARSSPIASTSCPSSTSSGGRTTAARVSAALWYDNAYGSLDNTNNATANTLVNGLPAPGVLSPYSKRYLKGPSGEWLDAFAFANFEALGMQWNVKAGQHTVYWGDSLLLGGAVHGVSYAQNSIDLMKGFGTPGAEAKELFRPKGGITLQTQATKDLSIAGAVVLQLAGGARARVGQLPDRQRRAAVRRRLARIRRPIRSRRRFPARRRSRASGTSRTCADSRYSASLGDWGISARWSPEWLDGTLGFYFRNATDILPQTVAASRHSQRCPRRTCTAIGGIAGLAARVHHQPEGDERRRPHAEGQGRRVPHSPTATTSTSWA